MKNPASLTFCTALFVSSALMAAAQTADAKPIIIKFDAPHAKVGPSQGTVPVGLNGLGDAVGFYTGKTHAGGFIRAADGTFETFRLKKDIDTVPLGINDAGATTGNYFEADGSSHGFVRDAAGIFTTFDPTDSGGEFGTQPIVVNDQGTVAGFFGDANNGIHGFTRAADGSLTAIDVQGAGSSDTEGTYVQNMSAKDVTTGYYLGDDFIAHAFIRKPTGKTVTFDVPGSTSTLSEGINVHGVVCGAYTDQNGANHGFVREPDGSISTVDVTGAGTGAGEGTTAYVINDKGAVGG